VKQLEDFVRVNEWIVVCIILYNILLSFKDEWTEDDIEEEEAVEEVQNAFNGDTDTGDNLRINVQNYL